MSIDIYMYVMVSDLNQLLNETAVGNVPDC